MSGLLPFDGVEPPSAAAALLRDLRPLPGRLADTVRLAVLVLLTVAVSETFRMPEIAVSAYVVLFVSRDEPNSTVLTATVAGIAVVAAAFATAVLFMASLSEPAVRVPLIAAATFLAFFLSRVSPLGPAAFASGFIMAYGLTVGDQVLGVALQSPDVGNTTDPGSPALLTLPPEEALLHFVLWLAPVVALPVALVVAANLLTGRQPLQVLRAGLAGRLAACAAYCAGEPGALRAIAAAARDGSGRLAMLRHSAGAVPRAPDYAALIDETERLAVTLLAWSIAFPADKPATSLRRFASWLRAAEHHLRPGAKPVAAPPPAPEAGPDVAQALGAEIAGTVAAISRAFDQPPATAKASHSAGHLIAWAAVRDPETTRFALKATLAVMLSYVAESLLDWPAIHTCVVTCFFVSLGTIGESVHKATLRIAGALVGGALGIASILLLMPSMTGLGDLLLALGTVTLLAGWVACGSERISYAGWQIGLAYYLTVLQGYGPTLDMQMARDRVIGIVLGNVMVLAMFTTVWPASIPQGVRRQVAGAITQMAALIRLEKATPGKAEPARRTIQAAFLAATNSARGLMANTDRGLGTVWHGAPRPVGPRTLADLGAVMVVISVISNLLPDASADGGADPARQAAHAYREAVAAWFDRCAAWVRSGSDAGTLVADIPVPPELVGGAQAAWHGILDRQLRAILARITRGADGGE